MTCYKDDRIRCRNNPVTDFFFEFTPAAAKAKGHMVTLVTKPFLHLCTGMSQTHRCKKMYLITNLSPNGTVIKESWHLLLRHAQPVPDIRHGSIKICAATGAAHGYRGSACLSQAKM